MKTSKKQKILEHLQKHGKISTIEAFEKYGETRLPAVIFNLRKEGMKIETNMIKFTDRFGEDGEYGEYTLIHEEE